MDATAMALKQPLFFSSCTQSQLKEERIMSGSVYMGRRKRGVSQILSSGFCDQGHLQYYSKNSKFGCCLSEKSSKEKEKKKKKMTKKKQLKLLKGLTKDLSTFSQIGFGLDSDGALLDQVKGNMVSEAAEVLLEQLQKIRAEEKRRMKEEKERLKDEMSSSSSSDSECGEVTDMKRANSTPVSCDLDTKKIEVCMDANSTPVSCDLDTKKIEVCMGGKCKKSGGGALLEEFERAGMKVSGCKCMGKCRDGPNVKVLNGGLCLGVGLEDVNMIVANLLGENHNQPGQPGYAAASAS